MKRLNLQYNSTGSHLERHLQLDIPELYIYDIRSSTESVNYSLSTRFGLTAVQMDAAHTLHISCIVITVVNSCC